MTWFAWIEEGIREDHLTQEWEIFVCGFKWQHRPPNLCINVPSIQWWALWEPGVYLIISTYISAYLILEIFKPSCLPLKNPKNHTVQMTLLLHSGFFFSPLWPTLFSYFNVNHLGFLLNFPLNSAVLGGIRDLPFKQATCLWTFWEARLYP